MSTSDMPLRSTRQRILALNGLKKFSGSTIKQSIRQRIVAIAVGLIILMLVTSVLSIAMVRRVGYLLDELSARYAPINAPSDTDQYSIARTRPRAPPDGDREDAGAARCARI